MQATYFAYGSNLLSSRMRERVPSARAHGIAHLAGWQLTTDKAGRDGTGKANLRPAAQAGVWGVVWRIDASEWHQLDACEGGYRRIEVSLAPCPAQTYVSTRFTSDPVLDVAYKRLLLEGAREHGLPAAWIAQLEALPAR